MKATSKRLSPEEIRIRAQDPVPSAATERLDASTSLIGQHADQLSLSPAPEETTDPGADSATDRVPVLTATSITRPTPTAGTEPATNNADRADFDEDASNAVVASDPSDGGATDQTTWVFSNDVPDEKTRRTALESIRPQGPYYEIAAVQGAVIDLILELVDFNSPASDRQLLQVNVQFARWCRNNSPDGTFDPARDYTEAKIADFLEHGTPGVGPRTRQSYASVVRRLRGHRRKPAKEERVLAQPPYPLGQRDRMWKAACDRDDWIGIEMRTLLSLTFGAGCRGEEVHALTAGQVQTVGTRVVVAIVKKHWVREVPVYGAQALWLQGRANNLDEDTHLFRPAFEHRRNATSKTIEIASKTTDAFVGWKTTRARHTWLCDLLVSRIPVGAICQAAGIGRNSNLITDMVPHLPTLHPRDVVCAFDRAFDPTNQDNS